MMTDTEILDTWLLKKSPKTQQMYTATWHAFFAWARTPAPEVTVPQIQEWLAQLPGSPATHTRKIRTLRSYYAWGIALGAWTDNPFARFSTPDPPTRLPQRIPSAAHMQALLHAADQDSPAAQALIHLLLGTGCALHELTLAHWTDWQPGVSVWIFQSKGHHRPVPLSPDTQEAIQRWHDTLAPASPTTPIFPSPKNPAHSLTVSALTEWFHRLTTAASLPDTVTPRWLRNYYGLTQLQQGVPLSVVQHRMGHAWILTTLPYDTLAKKLPPSS
jgi:site-specific recombinase XerD